jgi:hypothetical protein
MAQDGTLIMAGRLAFEIYSWMSEKGILPGTQPRSTDRQ